MDYYLSVDIGASSGRHMLFWMEDGMIRMKEIYRFQNGMVRRDGHLCWDLEKLFWEICRGMVVCRENHLIPKSMGIDTWGVDYVLLDQEEHVIGRTYGYRDERTDNIDETVYGVISEQELYYRTGIQKQKFNTIYQLMATKMQEPECLDKAKYMLMIPDYLVFLLTGNIATEYTNATTTQLVSIQTDQWDYELIRKLGLKEEIFTEIVKPGTLAGRLRKEVAEAVGFDIDVIRVASHDTASAVAAVPSPQGNGAYLSSGTWSLIGVELSNPDCSEESRIANFTNEGGVFRRFRYLKNIMGLWMIQLLQKECGQEISFAQLSHLAEAYENYVVTVDVNDERFLAPDSVKESIIDYCREHGQPLPKENGEFAVLIYRSLAIAYRDALNELEKRFGKKIEQINVVGGGSNAEFLNRLTARMTNRRVLAGPGEATAIGNFLVQFLADGKVESLEQARELVMKSFEIRQYEP